jgi:hypothetical protein
MSIAGSAALGISLGGAAGFLSGTGSSSSTPTFAPPPRITEEDMDERVSRRYFHPCFYINTYYHS